MGHINPVYEPVSIEILASVSIATAKTTSIVRLGLASTEDGLPFAGVQFHFQVTPTSGATDTGFTVNFHKSHDGVEVDDVIGPDEVAYTPASVGASPAVFHATENYLTENLGTAVRLELEIDAAGDRTLTAVVTMRRWRWSQAIG